MREYKDNIFAQRKRKKMCVNKKFLIRKMKNIFNIILLYFNHKLNTILKNFQKDKNLFRSTF